MDTADKLRVSRVKSSVKENLSRYRAAAKAEKEQNAASRPFPKKKTARYRRRGRSTPRTSKIKSIKREVKDMTNDFKSKQSSGARPPRLSPEEYAAKKRRRKKLFTNCSTTPLWKWCSRRKIQSLP